jgi:hypothetical protein
MTEIQRIERLEDQGHKASALMVRMADTIEGQQKQIQDLAGTVRSLANACTSLAAIVKDMEQS